MVESTSANDYRGTAVIILTWNGREDTLACLDSLLPCLSESDRAVVVDNGSEDGTIQAVTDNFPEAVCLENNKNLGFAGGNNTGLKWALHEKFSRIMLLNNDTLVPENMLSSLNGYLDSNPGVGVVQPMLVNADDPTLIDSSGQEIFRYPGARDRQMAAPLDLAPKNACPIFGACAAAALFRRETLEQTGLLDEGFFVLLEDVDLMFRIRCSGWDIHLFPQVRVAHKRGVSLQEEKEKMSLNKKFWLHRNILAIAIRYWPAGQLLLFSPFLLKAALWAIWAGSKSRAGKCFPLWKKSLKVRSVSRNKVRQYDVMKWQLPRPSWDIYLQWFRRRFLGLQERPWPEENMPPGD